MNVSDMDSAYKITGCTVKDGAELSHNNMSAFWQDPNWVLTWQHTTLEQHIVEQTKRYPRSLLKDRIKTRHTKVINAEGKLMGYARWKLPESHTLTDGSFVWPEAMVPEVTAEEEADINRVAESAVFEPDETNDDREFENKMSELNKKYQASKPYLVLDYLAIHPNNQGKGIASALIQHGLQKADQLDLDAFVLAFQAGIKLYPKFGFRTMEELRSSFSVTPEPYRVCFMERIHKSRVAQNGLRFDAYGSPISVFQSLSFSLVMLAMIYHRYSCWHQVFCSPHLSIAG